MASPRDDLLGGDPYTSLCQFKMPSPPLILDGASLLSDSDCGMALEPASPQFPSLTGDPELESWKVPDDLRSPRETVAKGTIAKKEGKAEKAEPEIVDPADEYGQTVSMLTCDFEPYPFLVQTASRENDMETEALQESSGEQIVPKNSPGDALSLDVLLGKGQPPELLTPSCGMFTQPSEVSYVQKPPLVHLGAQPSAAEQKLPPMPPKPPLPSMQQRVPVLRATEGNANEAKIHCEVPEHKHLKCLTYTPFMHLTCDECQGPMCFPKTYDIKIRQRRRCCFETYLRLLRDGKFRRKCKHEYQVSDRFLNKIRNTITKKRNRLAKGFASCRCKGNGHSIAADSLERHMAQCQSCNGTLK
uniref:Uncharacterized protein n=1 Tax=Lotharella oceanica TaxID=641309 RepID=A0A7S2TU60_9EUKA